jgi:hypothetical protein
VAIQVSMQTQFLIDRRIQISLIHKSLIESGLYTFRDRFLIEKIETHCVAVTLLVLDVIRK